MPRRVRLPGAGELFRSTAPDPAADVPVNAADAAEPGSEASGRVRHDQKITVYLSTGELEAIEDARIRLRREFGISVDRGRIVRAAVAGALSELTSAGAGADLVLRLGR
ncbi:hypothetical protein [Propionicicella superfundia]|uniref:hypothetical protein n=1 Tax=Propionicicella superfundia TaxID=348582 RepID=UPI00048F80F3|nr:hypothetical protein [Propionicicella superfundia]